MFGPSILSCSDLPVFLLQERNQRQPLASRSLLHAVNSLEVWVLGTGLLKLKALPLKCSSPAQRTLPSCVVNSRCEEGSWGGSTCTNPPMETQLLRRDRVFCYTFQEFCLQGPVIKTSRNRSAASLLPQLPTRSTPCAFATTNCSRFGDSQAQQWVNHQPSRKHQPCSSFINSHFDKEHLFSLTSSLWSPGNLGKVRSPSAFFPKVRARIFGRGGT